MFDALEELTGKRINNIVLKKLEEFDNFKCECDPDDELDKSGYIYITLDSIEDEVDDLWGTIEIAAYINVDAYFCITDIEPIAKFCYSGGPGDPELDAEEYWDESYVDLIMSLF